MRRALLLCYVALMALAPVAAGGTVSGRIIDSRLEVTFRAAPGESNEMRILPHVSGVRIVDARARIEVGEHCLRVNEHDARCGPPAPDGLAVTAFTGDRADVAATRNGVVHLGRGKDLGIALAERGSLHGGPGDDDLRAAGGGASLAGGAGRDDLLGFGRGDLILEGGPGPDFIVGGAGDDLAQAGRGRDRIIGRRGRDDIAAGPGDDFIRASDEDRDFVQCGSGRDRVFVSRSDRRRGCERVTFGWPD
jgi:RTX calcium-binding nonapeptide repeat (4 copies)